jgi:hypothetical protein
VQQAGRQAGKLRPWATHSTQSLTHCHRPLPSSSGRDGSMRGLGDFFHNTDPHTAINPPADALQKAMDRDRGNDERVCDWSRGASATSPYFCCLAWPSGGRLGRATGAGDCDYCGRRNACMHGGAACFSGVTWNGSESVGDRTGGSTVCGWCWRGL